jgi:hypothetical protein
MNDSVEEYSLEDQDDVGEIIKTSFHDIAVLTRTISELVDQVKEISTKMASIEQHSHPASPAHRASTSKAAGQSPYRKSKSVDFYLPPPPPSLLSRDVSDNEIQQVTERLTARLLGERFRDIDVLMFPKGNQ